MSLQNSNALAVIFSRENFIYLCSRIKSFKKVNGYGFNIFHSLPTKKIHRYE